MLSYVLAALFIFGVPAFWLVFRILKGKEDTRTRLLKKITIISTGMMLAAFGYVGYCLFNYGDWLHSLTIPYLVGFLSLLIAIIVVIVRTLQRAKIWGLNKNDQK